MSRRWGSNTRRNSEAIQIEHAELIPHFDDEKCVGTAVARNIMALRHRRGSRKEPRRSKSVVVTNRDHYDSRDRSDSFFYDSSTSSSFSSSTLSTDTLFSEDELLAFQYDQALIPVDVECLFTTDDSIDVFVPPVTPVEWHLTVSLDYPPAKKALPNEWKCALGNMTQPKKKTSAPMEWLAALGYQPSVSSTWIDFLSSKNTEKKNEKDTATEDNDYVCDYDKALAFLFGDD